MALRWCHQPARLSAAIPATTLSPATVLPSVSSARCSSSAQLPAPASLCSLPRLLPAPPSTATLAATSSARYPTSSTSLSTASPWFPSPSSPRLSPLRLHPLLPLSAARPPMSYPPLPAPAAAGAAVGVSSAPVAEPARAMTSPPASASPPPTSPAKSYRLAVRVLTAVEIASLSSSRGRPQSPHALSIHSPPRALPSLLFVFHAHRAHPLLSRARSRCQSPPPTASQRSPLLRSPHMQSQQCLWPPAPLPVSPHLLCFALTRSFSRASSSSSPPRPLLPSCAAAPSFRSQPAPMTVRQPHTSVMPLHRRRRRSSQWQPL